MKVLSIWTFVEGVSWFLQFKTDIRCCRYNILYIWQVSTVEARLPIYISVNVSSLFRTVVCCPITQIDTDQLSIGPLIFSNMLKEKQADLEV